MTTIFGRSILSVTLLVAAWAALFLQQFLRVEWLLWLPSWVPSLAGMAAIIIARPGLSGIGRRWRAAVAGAGTLVVIAGLLLVAVKPDGSGLDEEWRNGESQDIVSVIAAVGERIESLLDLSTEVGERTREFIQSRASSSEGPMDLRLDAFRELAGLSEQIRKERLLPAGTEIGLQLFGADGSRIAWAGWPQKVEPLDREYISSGREMIYSRQVSLYRILTHIIPIYSLPSGADTPSERDTGRKLATVLIDMPLEVNYKVNNKFLKSSSLADDIARGTAANVRFEYYPTDALMPATMRGIDRRPENRPRPKQRPHAGGKKPADDSVPPAGAAEGDDGGRSGSGRSRAPKDSTVGGVTLPASVELLGRVAGDQVTGLTGRAVIRSPLGNALFNVTAVSPPFSHFVENRNNRIQVAANLLILLAAIVLFAVSLARFPRGTTGPLPIVKAVYLVLVLALLRYALLWFQPNLLTSRFQIFEPAIFATPIFGGLMRSAGDLLITSVFFVVALYGVLKITREKERRHKPSPAHGFRWLFAVKGIVAAGAIIGVFELARRFIGSVVLNANPRLVGEAVSLFEPQIMVLHLSAFLMVGSIFLAGMICTWGFYRIKGRLDTGRASVVAAVVIAAVSLLVFRWELAFISMLVLLFIVFAPRIVQREDLVSIVITAFCFVVIVSAAAYVFFNQDYQGLRRTFIQEKVAEVTHPSDNWKVFILEDILENLAQENTVNAALRQPATANIQRLAFDLWADSPLSLLGYSCGIYVFDASDSLVSRFAVEMPYRLRATEPGERMETTSTEEWVVLDLTTQTPQGAVRFYRGIVNLHDESLSMRGVPVAVPVGKIVVDIPFFFENLAWAARTGPQTPEVLRNVQEGGIAPRLEETEAILLARLRGTRVLESSSENLPVGYTVDPGALQKGIDLDWPLLAAGSAAYRFLVEETEEPGSYLLAGFLVPSLGQHALRWSTILSLYFFFTVALIILIIMLERIPVLGDVLPTLTPGRQLGFQQKLLGSFLIVALLPAIILGLFTVRMIKDRFVEENKKEAAYRATSADKALNGILVEELRGLTDRYDLRLLIGGELPALYVHDPTRRVYVFEVDESAAAESDAGTGKTPAPRAREKKSDLNPPPAEYSGLAAYVERAAPERMFMHWIGGEAFLGVLSPPITVASGEDSETIYVYYARHVDGELLGEIAGRVGTDVSLFDRGELVATSREGLLSGGFISATMDADAFVGVSVMGVDQSLVTEKAGRYRYQVAYIPVPEMDSNENAAIGVPLLFRPESYGAEVDKATSIVLSLFALLSAATIGLGLLLARGIFEPLKGLLEATKRIARGDFSFELPSGRRDEIGTVVDAFNEMTSQVSHSQAALEERRRYLEAILVNIGTGVITTDSDDRIRAANNAAERILGIAGADLIGKTAIEMTDAGVLPEFFSRLTTSAGHASGGAASGGAGGASAEVADETERDGSAVGGDGGSAAGAVGDTPAHATVGGGGDEPIESEIDIIKDGQKRTIKYMQTRLSTEGRYLGTVFVFEDLTELISSKKLSAWVEMARQIAHEIKNPLTPIKLSAQFMVRAHEERSADFDKIFRESADTIIHQVDVLRNISSEFSSFGRLQQLHLSAHKVVPLLREIVAPYQRNTSRVEVTLEVPEDGLTATVDPEAVRKICTNLIENAMEAMAGGGELDIACRPAVIAGRAMVEITVRDNGTGLDEKTVERLFEPYFSTKTTGTGLGLAICRNLSRQMGGDVTVENLPDRTGVKATLYLRPA